MTTQRIEHPDQKMLNEIASAICKARGPFSLPTVRRDSPEWEAWRAWKIERGLPTAWSDKQHPAQMLTVVFEYPPPDLAAEHRHWVKGGGKAAKPDLAV